MTKGWLLHRKLYEPREEEQKEDEEDLIQVGQASIKIKLSLTID